jgi:hypothetical protein
LVEAAENQIAVFQAHIVHGVWCQVGYLDPFAHVFDCSRSLMALISQGSHARSLLFVLQGFADVAAIEADVLQAAVRLRPALLREIRIITVNGISTQKYPTHVSLRNPEALQWFTTSGLRFCPWALATGSRATLLGFHHTVSSNRHSLTVSLQNSQVFVVAARIASDTRMKIQAALLALNKSLSGGDSSWLPGFSSASPSSCLAESDLFASSSVLGGHGGTPTGTTGHLHTPVPASAPLVKTDGSAACVVACFSFSVSTPTMTSVSHDRNLVPLEDRKRVLFELNCHGFTHVSEAKLLEVAHILVDCIGVSVAPIDEDAHTVRLPTLAGPTPGVDSAGLADTERIAVDEKAGPTPKTSRELSNSFTGPCPGMTPP